MTSRRRGAWAGVLFLGLLLGLLAMHGPGSPAVTAAERPVAGWIPQPVPDVGTPSVDRQAEVTKPAANRLPADIATGDHMTGDHTIPDHRAPEHPDGVGAWLHLCVAVLSVAGLLLLGFGSRRRFGRHHEGNMATSVCPVVRAGRALSFGRQRLIVLSVSLT